MFFRYKLIFLFLLKIRNSLYYFLFWVLHLPVVYCKWGDHKTEIRNTAAYIWVEMQIILNQMFILLAKKVYCCYSFEGSAFSAYNMSRAKEKNDLLSSDLNKINDEPVLIQVHIIVTVHL